MAGLPNSPGIKVVVGAIIDDLVDGMKSAAAAVAVGVNQMRSSLTGLISPTTSVNTKMEDYAETVRKAKAEMTSISRTANFLARDFVAMIPGAEGARMAISSFIAVSLSGAGMLAVFQAMVAIMGLVAKAIEDAEKRAANLRHIWQNVADSATDAFGRIERGLPGTLSATQTAWHNLVDDSISNVRKFRTQVEDYMATTHIMREIFTTLGGAVLGRWNPIDTVMQQAGKLQAQADKEIAALAAQRPKMEATQGKEQIKINEEVTREIRSISARGADEIFAIEQGLQNRIEEIQRKHVGDEFSITWLTVAERVKAAREISRVEASRNLEVTNRERAAATVEGDFQTRERARLEGELGAIRLKFRDRLDKDNQAREEAAARKESDTRIHFYEAERDAKIAADEFHARYDQADRARREKQTVDEFKLREDLAAEEADVSFALGDLKMARELTRVRRAATEEIRYEEVKHRLGLISTEDLEARRTAITAAAAAQRNHIESEYAHPFIGSLVRNWETGLEQMLSGTYRWADLITNVFRSVTGAMIAEIVRAVGIWLTHQLEAIAVSIAAKFHEGAAHVAVEETKAAATTAAAGQQIAANAAVAATAGGATAAQTPGIGWLIAIPAAAAIFGAMIGYALHSAAQGFDVPAGSNPMTQLHGKEMVLPSGLAERVRNMTDPVPAMNITYAPQISALDAHGVDRVLAKNQAVFLRRTQQMMRTNRLPTRRV